MTTARNPHTAPHLQRQRIAIIGAGMAGIACARTLMQAGHDVSVFEQGAQAGGRTAALESTYGSFDTGAQYFTVRDARFQSALDTVPGLCRPWSASTIRVLDGAGRVALAAPPPTEAHWVAAPTMDALVRRWAEPLADAGQLHLHHGVSALARDGAAHWKLQSARPGEAARWHAGFDTLLLALPAPQAQALLVRSGISAPWQAALAQVEIAPCWTLMLAWPHAVRPGLTTLGPQWNAARSTHHRIAWLVRESSKPGRSQIERWTVQASPDWSREHLHDEPPRVQDKLLKAFAEVTGIHAAPTHAQLRRWQHAQTQASLGQSHLWDPASGLGACGDWCLGYRLEDAFVSGLALALAVA